MVTDRIEQFLFLARKRKGQKTPDSGTLSFTGQTPCLLAIFMKPFNACFLLPATRIHNLLCVTCPSIQVTHWGAQLHLSVHTDHKLVAPLIQTELWSWQPFLVPLS